MTGEGRRIPGCGSCLCEPVGVAWVWRLQGERGGGPGLSSQAWCYVVGLVFPHVAFPAWRNEWLPPGLWPWARLKEYTYHGPEYTPQAGSQSEQAESWLLNTPSQPSTCSSLPQSHCHVGRSEETDPIFTGGGFDPLSTTGCAVAPGP